MKRAIKIPTITPAMVDAWRVHAIRKTAQHGADRSRMHGNSWGVRTSQRPGKATLHELLDLAVECLARSCGVYDGDRLTIAFSEGQPDVDDVTSKEYPTIQIEAFVHFPVADAKKPPAE